MDIKVVTDIYRKQRDSLRPLCSSDERFVASIQTLRMSLAMLRYSLKEDVGVLFNLYDDELKGLLLEDVEIYSNEEDANCCVKEEEFSDDDKEDTDWASRLSKKEVERSIYPVGHKTPSAPDEKDDVEDVKHTELFYISDEPIKYDHEDPKYVEFLDRLALCSVYTRAPNKLYTILDMYKDENISIIKSSVTFKFLFENNCGDVIIDYLK